MALDDLERRRSVPAAFGSADQHRLVRRRDTPTKHRDAPQPDQESTNIGTAGAPTGTPDLPSKKRERCVLSGLRQAYRCFVSIGGRHRPRDPDDATVTASKGMGDTLLSSSDSVQASVTRRRIEGSDGSPTLRATTERAPTPGGAARGGHRKRGRINHRAAPGAPLRALPVCLPRRPDTVFPNGLGPVPGVHRSPPTRPARLNDLVTAQRSSPGRGRFGGNQDCPGWPTLVVLSTTASMKP